MACSSQETRSASNAGVKADLVVFYWNLLSIIGRLNDKIFQFYYEFSL